MNSIKIMCWCMAVILVSILINACAPAVVISPAGVTSPCDSVIGVDRAAAARNLAYEEENIFWSIHFNFKSQDVNGNPIGCFRLYARDTSNVNFVPIDYGGYPIVSCLNQEDANGKKVALGLNNLQLPFTSNGSSPVDTGVAIFNGKNHIECEISVRELTGAVIDLDPDLFELETKVAELDPNQLASDPRVAWLNQFGLNLGNSLPDKIIEELGELINRDAHPLKTLTLVAAGKIQLIEHGLPNPAFYYVPTIDDETSACESDNEILHCTPFGMELPTILDNAEGGTIRSYMQGSLFQGQLLQLTPPDPNCIYEQGKSYWWTDFNVSNQINPSVGVRPISVGADFPPPECTSIQWAEIEWGSPDYEDPEPLLTSLPVDRPINQVNVWTGPTKLYIGCRPDANGECQTFFNGELYGILIDPPNSKPQISSTAGSDGN